jgi:zinc D-Ala-D-Ala carboxypeptidase
MAHLSPHFSVEELTATQHRFIDNVPDEAVLGNLKLVADTLEQIRATLGKPMIISSGYRSLALNRQIGSKDTSAHVLGLAADFISPEFGNPYEVFQKVRSSGLVYDQIILEKLGGKEWVHIGLKPQGEKPRQQALLIDASGTKLV